MVQLSSWCCAPEAGGLGQAKAVEGKQLEGLRQDELPAGRRCCAVLAVAEELVDALAQQLVLAGRQRAARDVSVHLPRHEIGLCVQVCALEDLPQQLGHRQGQVVHPASSHCRLRLSQQANMVANQDGDVSIW